MAYSYTRHTGDGSTDQYAINFTLGYISRNDVHAYVNDTEIPFTWVTSGIIKLSVVPAVGDHILLRRIVDSTELVHDYADGAVIIERNLDESNMQTLMLMHEVLDGFISLDINEALDMRTNRIINLGDPTQPQDAATKYYVDYVADLSIDIDQARLEATTAATAAGNSETASAASEAAAESSKDSAETAATQATQAWTLFSDVYHGALMAPPAGADAGDLYFDIPANSMFAYTGTHWEQLGGENNMTLTDAVGINGSTVVSVSYSGDAMLVIINGYVLPKSAYQKHNGTSVTVLNTEAGDEIQILAFDTVTATSYYTKDQIDARLLYGATDPPSPVGLVDGTLYFKYIP